MTDNKPDFTLVKPGDTKEQARAAVVALFAVIHGRESTPEEVRKLDAKLHEMFESQAEAGEIQ